MVIVVGRSEHGYHQVLGSVPKALAQHVHYPVLVIPYGSTGIGLEFSQAVTPLGGPDGEGQARKARGEPPDSAATAAELALQILEGNAMSHAPCLKMRDINRIG